MPRDKANGAACFVPGMMFVGRFQNAGKQKSCAQAGGEKRKTAP
jgi:hypothetical protein